MNNEFKNDNSQHFKMFVGTYNLNVLYLKHRIYYFDQKWCNYFDKITSVIYIYRFIIFELNQVAKMDFIKSDAYCIGILMF